MSKVITMKMIAFLAILLFIAGCASQQGQTAASQDAPVITEAAPDQRGSAPVTSSSQANAVTFRMEGENFRFMMGGQENPELRVKQGDIVRIEFKSASGFHDWVVDEFGARTEQVNTGGASSVEFVASQKGTFEYYCSVGQHRQNGMKGNLIVE